MRTPRLLLAVAPLLVPSLAASQAVSRDSLAAQDTAVATPSRSDTTRHPITGSLFGQSAGLGLAVRARLEIKGEQNRNERCATSEFLDPLTDCRGSFQPRFGLQFGVKSNGTLADRVHVDVDYDSQREFDASNNISVYYEGRPNELLQRVEVGNVSFAPPSSHFITAGIPSGNYGVQALGHIGPMSFRAIAAQQKSNVVQDRMFTVGDRTVQTVDREIDDYQLERRRFFWVVDPRTAFPTAYPNIDILSPSLVTLAAQMPPGERPRRVLVYRYRAPSAGGSAARDINGPYAATRYARNGNEVGPFELLRQGVDYYIDPSNLWIALVTPIGPGERLAVSYTVTGPGGDEAIVPSVGGTFPTVRHAPGTDTLNLLWDSDVLPGDPAFDREIRSVYRLGGGDIQRESVTLKIVVGSGNDQEKPVGGTADSYLQLFGLAQRNNPSTFDAENRLWPRMSDPNTQFGAAGGDARLILDYFVVFPSLQPFADSGLVHPPNPVNDSLYRTPDEDLSSPRRPPTRYRLLARYSAAGGGNAAGTLMLGSVQLRPNSERIFIDGVQLQRGVDYHVDYDLGRVVFTRPDTLFPTPRRVSVQYEENPLFAAAPTSMFGLATAFNTEHGTLRFTAISRAQKTAFNRPPLGLEPASAMIAGVNGDFTWRSDALTRVLDRLTFATPSTPATVNVQGEFATSRPHASAAAQAYVESFDGNGGISIGLQESAWRLGSQPAIAGAGVSLTAGAYGFPLDSASTMAWQNTGAVENPATGQTAAVQFFPEQIDSQFVFTGGHTFRSPETVLWLDLYPASVGGLYRSSTRTYLWKLPAARGRRWRSISQSLSPTGMDLSRVQQLEFWALIDTTQAARLANPTLIFDFGDISENSIAFAPETLTVTHSTAGGAARTDSVYSGRRLRGYDRLDSERDPITRSFDASRNDTGLPGDVADTLVYRDPSAGTTETRYNVPLCRRGDDPIVTLGNTRSNCAAGNHRLDEEDLDLDGVLNFPSASRNAEQLLRYVVDLSDHTTYGQVGRCYRAVGDTTTTAGGRTVCWVHVQLPFTTPTARVGNPLVRRIKSLRITMVSGVTAVDPQFTLLPIARLQLTGSPWTKRADRALAGVGGTRTDGSGYVVATTIGTQDHDAARGLLYASPPGVTDQADNKQTTYAQGTVQVNERALRLVAGDVPLYHRAEAFYTFPEGSKNFMGYRELRVWARGRNKGWGEQGDLQFYIKMGRDADNFYMYRTPVNDGMTRAAWLPEVRVDFNRFYALRAAIQNAYLRGGDTLQCTGLDSALVANSEPSPASLGQRYAACDGGYIVYTTNPAVSAPNLAAVQELAVGMVRVDTAGRGSGGLITAADSLELWVDDIRLASAVNDPGYAGQIGLTVAAGDLGSMQVNVSRRDENFHQLGEQPTYNADNQLNVGGSIRLDKFLPASVGLVLPFRITHTRSATDPFFLAQSDVEASGIAGLRTPRATTTSYALSARRSTPLANPVLGPIVNNLSLNASYVTSSARSELQTGSSHAFTGALDYDLVAAPRTISFGWLDGLLEHLPSWLRQSDAMRGLEDASLRWNPTQLRITSAYTLTSDRRASFARPIAFAGDSARRVLGLTDVWQTTGTLELRPFSALTARWNISSLRDLRDYGDSTPVSVVAGAERERFAGMDVGLERERRMSTIVSFTPALASWIQPRLDFSTTYVLRRDPNVPSLVQTGDSVGAFRLPRRLSSTQGFGASATIDVGRAITEYAGGLGLLRPIAAALQPLDITWHRDLRSAFDGVPFTPSLGYQLALGGVDAFRSLDGTPATSAGVTRNFGLDHTVLLPLGLTVVNRYARTTSTSWAGLLGAQSVFQARQVTFPDLSLRWSSSPAALRGIISGLGAQAGMRVTTSSTAQPSAGADGARVSAGLRTEQTVTQYPVNASITWASAGALSTSAGWNTVTHTELRSGGVTDGRQHDLSVDVSRSFGLPAGWKLGDNQLRTRLGFQRTDAQSFFVSDTTRQRVTDTGRWSVSANADTDLSDTMGFSMTLSRTETFDRNYDRRFTQTVLSAVFNLQFFAGAVR